jgi:double-stranded uracil-DNA glycosylase
VLPDILRPGLSSVFVGTSVATASAERRHYYSGPGNKFWQLLWEAGLTGDRALTPEEDGRLLGFGLGITDLVKGRAASNDGLLRSSDFDVGSFVERIETVQPRVVAFNGRTSARVVAKALHGLKKDEVLLGPAAWPVANVDVFVLPSSSGSSGDPRHFAPRASKADWWCELGSRLRNGTDSGR